MKRRDFLQKATIAGLGAGLLGEQASAADTSGKSRDIYEFRNYTLKTAKKPLLDDYLSKAFIPAVHRLGAGPVGVFTENLPPDKSIVYVLVVFKSGDQCVTLSDRLIADSEHQTAGAEYLAAVAADPVYERIESSLHVALEGMAHLDKPDTSKARILNLRIYESHNERGAKKKIEMFNLHEMPIFLSVGLKPVFFSETIVGSNMPNLTYMLVFPDDAERAAAWKRFTGSDDWKKLKTVPEYADKAIVSHITNKILMPEPYSEI